MPLLLLAPLAGCASTPTRFWTIEPVALSRAAAPRAGAPIQVVAVHVPLAIDRLEVVQHDAANRIAVRDFDRWSAPPGDLIRRALTQDLIRLLPADQVILPDAPAPTATRRISVDILDFRRSGDRYVMQASWSVAAASPLPHPLVLAAPAGAGDVASQTAALDQITGDLASAIVRDLDRSR